MIYLDHNATTPLGDKVLSAMEPFLKGNFGNPSSFYRPARAARAALERARSEVAACLGARPSEIVFTGSGTEADNLALRGAARALRPKGNHIITTSIEHHAVLHTCRDLEAQGFQVTCLPVDRTGRVDPDELALALTEQTILISIMHANNETGVIQPIEEIARITRSRGIVLHTDAVQSAGKIPLEVDALKADLVTISAHKFYGPKGAGALYVRQGTPLEAVITGGAQEKGLRPGTENMAGIVGLASALRLAVEGLPTETPRLLTLRQRFEQGLIQGSAPLSINAADVPRVPNTTNVTFPGVEGESLLLHLDLNGICASSGSACTTGSQAPSHVLLAMGIPPREAQGSLRFSLGHGTTEADIDTTLAVIQDAVHRLRAISSI